MTTQTNWFEPLTQIDLRNLREYIETFENSLAVDIKKFTDSVEAEAAKLGTECPEGLYDFYAHDHWKLSEVFPTILRSSLFITCYSLLEHRLISICNHLQGEHKYPIGLSDIRNEGILGAKTYLKKVAGINFPDQTPFWTEICYYRQIRNIVVHKNGRLDNIPEMNGVKSFITSKKTIQLDNFGQIQFSKDFCPEVISTVEGFFKELFNEFK